MSDPNKKTLIEITYVFADLRATAPSPFVGELFTIDEEQGDVMDTNNSAGGCDFLVLTDKTILQRDGTRKLVPGSRVLMPRTKHLWRTISVVTRERKASDPVRADGTERV